MLWPDVQATTAFSVLPLFCCTLISARIGAPSAPALYVGFLLRNAAWHEQQALLVR